MEDKDGKVVARYDGSERDCRTRESVKKDDDWQAIVRQRIVEIVVTTD